jgi:hypothetical protein
MEHHEQHRHEQVEALDRHADPEPRHRHRRAAQQVLVGGPGNRQGEVQAETCVVEEGAAGFGRRRLDRSLELFDPRRYAGRRVADRRSGHMG